jgi:hypothetical protein
MKSFHDAVVADSLAPIGDSFARIADDEHAIDDSYVVIEGSPLRIGHHEDDERLSCPSRGPCRSTRRGCVRRETLS